MLAAANTLRVLSEKRAAGGGKKRGTAKDAEMAYRYRALDSAHEALGLERNFWQKVEKARSGKTTYFCAYTTRM
jgi:stalled ribosome alternative rescue factor ArfA